MRICRVWRSVDIRDTVYKISTFLSLLNDVHYTACLSVRLASLEFVRASTRLDARASPPSNPRIVNNQHRHDGQNQEINIVSPTNLIASRNTMDP